MASLDLMNSSSGVGPTHWIEAQSHRLLVALAGNKIFVPSRLTDRRFDTREL